ncbi:hypothetical protein NLJ89_g5352 [Agrocybe chaxingu]|uniref:Polysaccharide lyase 14 domain-containing protein n=1 Tax=Agrocybe chaxingu TaxID=84603 RepID=A0A9W8K2I3_9AGAR|nr:hypothetical protein NLJ89_g5352 [Agrocybe chaxingu]
MGGAEFYASPIDISGARNVTLRYSVFFPVDFDWVLAGKLPGLYGGHTGCSGGNAALDCFSTRLMWRADGAGELYLYAPKDKQTDALCTARGSVCDAAYGLSIGRGSFTWTAGAWTTIHQTVYLNTPGEQDGVFTLDVNGKTVIHRKDVFYREDIGGSGGGKDGNTTKPTSTPTKTTKHSKPTTSTSDDGGLLGPILGLVDGLFDGGRREEAEVDNRELRPRQQESVSVNKDAATTSGDPQSTIGPSPQPTVAESQPTETGISDSSDIFGIQSAKPKEVKFAGIFFSTFFGGHSGKYATPRDQYVWFRDFALAHNF